MDSPDAVLDEVLFIMTLIQPQTDPSRLTNAFGFMMSLYQGQWPGERACNTHYHDLRHITDTMLAMMRLIHGAVLTGSRIKPGEIFIGLVGALAHDAGYIQNRVDSSGTGAKYTTVHVERSMAFIEQYGHRFGLTSEGIEACQLMIHCTDLAVDVSTVRFPSRTVGLLAKLLGCADLIGQMADRTYLEKLFYLYREFEEGQVSDYRDEMDLLTHSLAFFPMVEKRLKHQLGGYDKLAQAHFARRWGVAKNLYRETIEKQKKYLEHILTHKDRNPSEFLRRKRIVEKLLTAKQVP
ncbi:MAG: hypothetical protein PVI60_14390 [Desulfobacteraceae bacterium]|jgi:hypothetical protein